MKWIYVHMLQAPHDRKPWAKEAVYDTKAQAEQRRADCIEMNGCCGSCIRAGSGHLSYVVPHPTTKEHP